MVAVFNKEVLSWYLITLKLKETLDGAAIPKQPNTTNDDDGHLHLLPPPTTISSSSPSSPDPDWIIAIRDKLEEARKDEIACPWPKLCIYRVPRSLRDGDDKPYAPQLVSLGPYHHAKRRLRHVEPHKWRALYHVLRRTGHDVTLYLNSISDLEEKARACYDGGSTIALSPDGFVQMLVLDGCFAIELFRGAVEGFSSLGYSRNDPVFAMRGLMHSIQRDMIMLENQLPLFVLDRLLGLQLGRPHQRGLVADLALRFFDPLMPTDEPPRCSRASGATTASFDPLADHGGGQSLHCLDVFRRSLLLAGPQPQARVWMRHRSKAVRVADKRRQQLVHCVTELREAGIKFKKRRTDRFWDVKFSASRGVLKIPRLLIHDGTKSLFLNLIAFEQCHLDCSNDITSYVIFMDSLINGPDDVGYLHYCGIIEHWLGSDGEVADLFNRLCQEVVFDINDSYLSRLSEQMNLYYNHRWNAWRASLKHKYFSNPWAIISLIAAVALLLLTLTQTFYGVYAYYKPV